MSSPARGEQSRTVSRGVRLLAATLALVCALLGLQSFTAAPASAAALLCDPDTVYGIAGTNLSAVDVTTGAVTGVATMPNNTNGLAVSVGGTYAYAYSNGGSANTMNRYNAIAGTVSDVTNFHPGGFGGIRAAVNPVTGYLYYGDSAQLSGGVTTVRIGAYDPATGDKFGQVATVESALGGSGGDIAFDRNGTMYILIGASVLRINEAVPTASGTTTLTTTAITTIAGISASPGLAFSANGHLYVSDGSSLRKIHPVTGAQVGGTVTISGGFNPQDLASCTYPTTLSSSVDLPERMNTGDQFSVAMTGGGLSSGNTGTTTGTGTGARRVAGPVLGLSGDTYTATQTMSSGSPADYSTTYACTAAGTTIASGTSATANASVTFTAPTGTTTDVDCRFTNTPRTAALRVSTLFGGARADAADQARSAVSRSGTVLNSTTNSTTAGSGSSVTSGTGTTGATTVVATRAYDLISGMAPGAASVTGQYSSAITCTDANGLQAGLPTGAPFTGSRSISPVAGADISCIVTSTAIAPSLTVLAALADPRADDDDEFTVAVRDGSSSGAVLNATTTSTSAGAGSTVTGGTGTTGPVALTPNQAVAVLSAATAHAGAYSSRLTCVDAAGFQTGLPSNAGFTGSAAVTPVAGAAITCTVTNSISGTSLAVAAALGSPRDDDADETTVRIRTGGSAGTVVGTTGSATTTGTGSTVTSGTGTTELAAATSGTAYTITTALAAGSASVAGQYTSTITCTDANGLQTALPTSAPFTGSTTITPRPGAVVSCTVTSTAVAPSVAVLAALADPRADDTDQFTVALRDGSSIGPVLNATGAATTAGVGATVTSGTGTTGSVALGRRQPVAVLSAVSAHAAAYSSRLTCVDANGFQTGLPSNAVYSGSEVITPVAGAAITCTVSNSISGTSLALAAALGSARYDDADEVTVQIRTGGPSGTVVGTTGSATTTGSGSVVTSGTGTTALVSATAGTVYTITAPLTGNSARYGRALSCTDANGLQTSLPAGTAFSGSATITPRRGAVISCTVTTALAAAALTVAATGPSSVDVGVTGRWNLGITNAGGTTASGVVAIRLPADVAYSGVVGTGWSCVASGTVATGQQLDCTGQSVAGGTTTAFAVDAVPQAAAGATTVQLRAAVSPSGTGAPVMPASCTGAGAPTAGCTVAGATVVGDGVRLRVEVAGPTRLVVGVRAEYELTVDNTGTGPAGSAVVETELPAGFSFDDVTGASCTLAARTLSCTVPGPIAAGGAAAVRVRATPQPAAAGAPATLRAAVAPTGSATPPTAAACTATSAATGCATTTTTAVPVADGIALGIDVTGPTGLTVGVPATYAFAVGNPGTGPAGSATVAVALPPGLRYIGAAGADCVGAGDRLTCRVSGPIAAGGLKTFTVRAMPEAELTGPVVVRATVDPTGGASPAEPATAPRSETCDAVSAPVGTVDLRLGARATPVDPAGARVVAGDRIAFHYTVTNDGVADIVDLVVTAPGVGTVRCAATVLAVGASTSCTAGPVTVTQADVDRGLVQRPVTASARPAECRDADECPPVRSNRAETTTAAKVIAHVDAMQTVRVTDRDGDGLTGAGDVARFTVVVTNDGTVTLHDLRLTDALLDLDCPRTTLAVGESMRCTGARLVTKADVAAGRIRSFATATGSGPAGLGGVTASSERTLAVVPTGSKRPAALAETGFDVLWSAGSAAVLLVLGAALLLLARRRRRRA